ncbi:MAG: [protein-PII] uridylyltransferase [Acidimicrobiales bacterium]
MPPVPTLRSRHDDLVADRSLTGTAWCVRFAEACDDWLGQLFNEVTAGDGEDLALLAVGGYGVGELAPGSDLDLLLVHDRKGRSTNVAQVADGLWYPIWDEGVPLDHSVRNRKEVRAAVDSDLKVALGLLTARPVAGDRDLAAKVIASALDQWRRRVGSWLPQVADLARQRHHTHGDVAFTLEPDLKEGRGGIRDLRLLDAAAVVSPVLTGVALDPSLRDAAGVLAAARVELQRASGRAGNILLLQDQDVVAAALGKIDADALMADVADAARSLAWASDDGWRRVGSWLRGPRGRGGSGDKPLEPGLVRRDDEVALTTDADPAADPSLALRVAAASAELDLPVARTSLDRLAASTPEALGPWPPDLLRAFIRLLGAGRPTIGAIEALDQLGVWGRLLPEWDPVRNRPQRNAYHRFTVDRHLLETVANASTLVRTVARPDLLLVGALLHDIGKGRGGDHTEIGIKVVGDMAPRMGFGPGDTATLEAMVRLHLVLSEVATRRDIDDPVTVSSVAEAVGDARTLELLAALTEADSLATGPSAWGPWKAGLVGRLVERVGLALAGTPHTPEPVTLSDDEQRRVAAGVLDLVAAGNEVLIVAPDRTGLLATVAGVLALRAVAVRSAVTRSGDAGGGPEAGDCVSDAGMAMAVLHLVVTPALDVMPDWDRVRSELTAALAGRLALDERLAERERAYAGRRRVLRAEPVRVRITVDNDAASDRTLVEVRAPDRGPVLYRVAKALTGTGATIDAALVNTLGAEVVDVFYLTGSSGDKLAMSAEMQTTIEAAVAGALSPP